LAEAAPLATLPILGHSLLEYWLEHLAGLGAKEARVLAADRPEQVRVHTGTGSRWGLHVEVLPETRELSLAEAQAKYGNGSNRSGLKDVIFLDHLPSLPKHALLNSYADWCAAVFGSLPRISSPLRVGMRQIQPGVWAGLRTHVSPGAHLCPPCWLGHNVWVGAGALVGPRAVVEDRAFVEAGATIANSIVGPETFVGGFSSLQDSLAWGSTLINWRTGSTLEVADPFLLSALRPRRSPFKQAQWPARLAALGLMVATFPAAALLIARATLQGRPAIRKKMAVCPQSGSTPVLERTVSYYELASINRWLRRWPQLWNIVRSEFTWVGNRPLSPSDAGELRDDFERLWLAAPIGIMSLADAAGCKQAFGDEARAHASFYAVKAGRQLDCSILLRVLVRSLIGPSRMESEEALPLPLASHVVKGGS
jgi:hypothetical protein